MAAAKTIEQEATETTEKRAIVGLSSSEVGSALFFYLLCALCYLLFKEFAQAVNVSRVGSTELSYEIPVKRLAQ
jgi:hypothetical protein